MSDEKKQLSKARQALVDRVLSRLDAGAMPWDNGMQGAFERPRNAITGKPYRGMNVLNLMLEGKSDPRWLTFNQASDAGYSVKKGAKGVPIELYKTIDKRTGKDADFAAIKEEIKDMTYEELQAFKKENLQSFARSYYVFNASDVAGIEPYRAPELTPADISARNERIEAVIAASEAPIFYDGNGRNYYSHGNDEIHLTERTAFKSDEYFYNTALHEEGHSTGHKSRLNRDLSGAFGTPSYAREDLVAEISSVLTAAELGLNHSDRVIENSAEYVRDWAQLIRDNPQTLIDATFDASRATDYICDRALQREQVQEKTQKESEATSKAKPSEQQQSPSPIAHTKPLVVNFYGGPSCGKTTAALELTAALKKAGYNVEYVSEYAKELVLENRIDELKNQQHVTDMQYKWLDRIRQTTDVIITDSPVLLGLVYGEFNGISEEYTKQIRGYYDSFDNFNMFVTRPKDASFQQEGRVHDEKQSIELDGKIKAMLDKQGVFYGSYKRDDISKTVERIGQTYNRLYGGQEIKTQKESEAASKTTSAAPTAPGLKTNLDNIPDAMKALPNWVAFRTKTLEDGKVKKILLSPNKGASSVDYLKWAKSNDPTTWATFDKAAAFAKKYKLDGLAFAMGGSGMTCIDLDHHLDENGKPTELAQKFVNAAQGTYVEKSVSGRGLHIFYAGSRPDGYVNRNIELDLETYDSARFMSMTGNLYGDAPKEVAAPSAELTNLLKSNLGKVQQYSAPSTPLGLSDNELIDRIRNSKVGRDFEAMWRGENICGDHSVSDLKLCNMLAFFSGGDVTQVEQCFKSSGLYRPQKGEAYVRRTAEKACSSLTKTYTPPKPRTTGNSRRGNAGSGSGR